MCHAGAGIISAALAAGRKPIVVPRRAALGEHVDDHQHQLASKLADWDLVVPVQRRITEGDVASASQRPQAPGSLRERPSAIDVLRAEVRKT